MIMENILEAILIAIFIFSIITVSVAAIYMSELSMTQYFNNPPSPKILSKEDTLKLDNESLSIENKRLMEENAQLQIESNKGAYR